MSALWIGVAVVVFVTIIARASKRQRISRGSTSRPAIVDDDAGDVSGPGGGDRGGRGGEG